MYSGLTTTNAQMCGWNVVAMGSDKEQVATEAEGAIKGDMTDIYVSTLNKNLVIVSKTVAYRKYGIRDHHIDAYLAKQECKGGI